VKWGMTGSARRVLGGPASHARPLWMTRGGTYPGRLGGLARQESGGP
jgi:hypothetical protein